MRVNIEVQNICLDKNRHRGIQRYTLELIAALTHRHVYDYSFTFFDYKRERNNRFYVEDYIGEGMQDQSIYECNNMNYKWIMSGDINGSEIGRFINYKDYFGMESDVYHFPHSVWLPPVIKGNVVVTVHDVLPILSTYRNQFASSFVNEFEKNGRAIVDNNYIVITDSQNTKKDFLEYFGGDENNIHVIPLGCRTDFCIPDNKQELLNKMGITRPYLLYLGALDERKGIGDILNAFSVIGLRSNIDLVIAGDYNPDHIDSISSRIKNCKSNAIVTGYISEEQKRILMSCAEIFLFPSEYEGFGLPVLEAMACGVPVITCNTSSLPEVGGDAVVYVTPHNVDELINAIELLLNDETLRWKFVDRGLERCKLFSWDKVAADTEKVYEIANRR